MKKILSILLLAIMLLNFSVISATDISSSGPVVTDEPNDNYTIQISSIRDMVMSMPHNIKYDMGFVVGRLMPDGSITPSSNSIVTNNSEPLEYNFDISLQWNETLYNFYLGLYNDDNSFKIYTLLSGGNQTIRAGTKFCLWFQYKDKTVKLDSIYDDIFYSLNIISHKDVVYRDKFFKEGIFTTEMPLEGVKEIYVEGAEGKELVVGQIRKNFFSTTTGIYWTTFYLAFADAPTTFIAQYTQKTNEPITDFDTTIPIELTQSRGSGVSGYAIVDFNVFPDGTSYQPKAKINMTKATSLALNPQIKAYFEDEEEIDGIVALNKDVEHLVMQASKSRSSKFGDTLVPLEFVHFTDIHSHKTEWKRIVKYIDKYEEYIDFVIHTGDYSGTAINQAIDLYSLAKPKNRIIYNAVGNHDTYSTYNNGKPTNATTKETYNAVFSDTENWDVVFGDEAYATYYYKDFYESGVRLIVLNDQQWTDAQGQWLSEVLVDANQNGLAVITASHMSAGYMAIPVESSFTPVDNNSSFSYWWGGKDIGPYIVEFKNNGGEHIAHLCGHNHFDDIGYTKEGILNIQLECASSTPGERLESVRVKGTKSFDCFNVMAVDVNTKRIKIVRIGCNSNAALQGKTVFSYDYENKKVIANY